jgi:outer membrane lipoprotein-sorting protein
LFFFFGVPAVTSASPKEVKKTEALPATQLARVLSKYQNSPLVVMKTKKSVESDFLEKTNIYTGELALSKDRFRWKTLSPEVSEVVFDGQSFYSIQDQQVIRSKLTSALKQQSLMTVLFDPKRIQEKFFVKAHAAEGKSPLPSSKLLVALVPKKKDMEISDLRILVDTQQQKLERVSYRDEVGNRVEITIESSRFESAVKKETFSYQPKQNEKIIDL